MSTPSLSPYFILLTGQIGSWFGSELVQFALVWWLTKTTGQAAVLTLATTIAVLPSIFVGPFAGALVDRWNRRMVMMAADGVIAGATLLLALLFASGWVQLWQVYAILLIRALAGVFHQPAILATTPLLVPEKHLARVAGLNQSLYGLVAILAPPFGALLLEWFPMSAILAIDVVTAAIAIGSLLFLTIPQPARTVVAGAEKLMRAVLTDLYAGLRFIWRFTGLRLMLTLVALPAMLGWPMMTLIPLLITKHFDGGAFELGWFQSVFAIGSILGGFLLTAWGGFQRRIHTWLVALILGGLALTLVGLMPADALLWAAAAWFMAGIMSALINGASLTIFQTVVPEAMLGRVFALQLAIVTSLSPLGLYVAGQVADRFGAAIWFVLAGSGYALAGLIAPFIPALMRIEEKGAHTAP